MFTLEEVLQNAHHKVVEDKDEAFSYLQKGEILWFELEDGYGVLFKDKNLLHLKIITDEEVNAYNHMEAFYSLYEKFQPIFYMIEGIVFLENH